jgi:5-methylcytosine-specific restriction protein B
MTDYGEATEAKISEIIEACKRHGDRSIIALSGVPGTGKSFMASIAAQRYAGEPTRVREVQFHQSFSYDEFIEGLTIGANGEVIVKDGSFLDWNRQAKQDPDRNYVYLAEEVTRADLSSVLGELLTYLEYRDRSFLTMHRREPVSIADNLVLLATFNPTDRTALEIDNALLRRFRVISCPPDTDQLREMVGGDLGKNVVDKLCEIFHSCEEENPVEYEHLMPFGHGIFDGVTQENPDLHNLWDQRIRHFLYRPGVEPHPLAETIENNYPWTDPDYSTENGSTETGEAVKAADMNGAEPQE